MKRSTPFFHSRRFRSFTLVELLVVMGIIAILAGVLFSAGGAAIRSAQRTRAAVLANSIQTAVLGYYTEYSVYPLTAAQITAGQAGTDASFASNDPTDWGPLTIALCGGANPLTPGTAVPGNAVSNTRSIAFLNLKKSDVDSTTGVPINPLFSTLTGNNCFNISMDADYNGVISNLPSAIAPTYLTNVVAAGAAVWANCNTGGTTNASFYVKTF